MSDFNRRICALVKLIPPGRVLSYGRVAALLGVPRGARAVGWALHALPLESDVPWHRVVNAQGMISTRCDTHAAFVQRDRLLAEGVQFDDSDDLKLSAFNVIMWSPSPLEVEALLAAHTGQEAT